MFIVGKSFFSEMLSKFDIKTTAPLCIIHIICKVRHIRIHCIKFMTTKRLSSIRVSGNARAVGFSHLGRANVCGAFLLRILNHIFFRFLVEQPIILPFPWDIWEIPALVLSFSLLRSYSTFAFLQLSR